MQRVLLIFIVVMLASVGLYSQGSNVNDFSRSLRFSYPISSNSVDGYPYNVSLEYNSNVPVISLEDYWKDTTTSGKIRDGWKFRNGSRPYWIMGINGIAIQVFSHKAMPAQFWVQDYDNDTLNGKWKEKIGFFPYYIGTNTRYPIGFNSIHSQFHWIIQGYDVSNRLFDINEEGDQDIIKILKTDGSSIEFRNTTVYDPNTMTESDEALYTGTYYISDMNNHGFAKVSIDTSWWPEYFKKHAPYGAQRVKYKPRIMRYYPGDGLEYVFKEHIAPYGARIFTNEVTISKTDTIPLESPLTAFYLTAVNTPQTNITEIKREFQAFDSTNQVFRGVPAVKEFKHHKIIQNVEEMIIDAYGTKNYIKYTTYKNREKMFFNSYKYNIWQDEVIDAYSARSYLFTNIEEELSRAYNIGHMIDSIGNMYFTKYDDFGYGEFCIDEIRNEEGDKIDFKYFTRDMDIPGYPSDWEVILMDSIKYTDRIEVFEYDQDGYDYDHAGNNDKIKIYDVNLFNQVKKKTTYENNSGVLREKLVETYEYETSSNLDSVAYTKVKVTDKETNDSLIKKRTYVLIEEDPIFENENQPYMSPGVSTFEVVTEYEKNRDIEITSNYKYGNFKDSTGSKFNSKYNRYIVESNKTLTSGGFVSPISKKKFFYEFENVTTFDGTDTLKNSFGRVPKKITTESYKPNITASDELLFKTETDFLHLPYIQPPTMRIDSVWNIQKSIDATIFKQFFEHEKKTVKLFDTTHKYSPVFVSPQLFLVKKEAYYDSNDSLIGGMSYNYETNYYLPTSLGDRPPHIRGALLSDSIFGKDYSDIRLLNTYNYKEGWYRSALNKVTNSEGAFSRLYYDYDSFTSELTGIYHLNNHGISAGKMFREYHQYEVPLVNETYIRKYNASGDLDTTVIRNSIELNKYGRVARMLDPNGNIYQTNYDKINRANYIWHPYDYPPGAGTSGSFDDAWTFEFDCNKLIDLYTEIRKRLDSLDRSEKIFTHSEEFYDTLLTENLLVGTKYSLSTPIRAEFIDSLESNKEEINTEQYFSYFSYRADSLDLIYNQSIDTLRFNFDLAGAEINNAMHITLSNDKFNFEKRIIIGAEILGLDSQAPTPLNSYESTIKVTFDVSPLIDSLKTLNYGETVEFKLSSSSERGWVELLKPCLEAKKADALPGNGIFNDYTYHFEYDNNKTNIFAKIDDDFHTYNSEWEATWGDRDGRYKRMDLHHGLYNRAKKSDVYIGHPDSPERLDTFSTVISGFGKSLRMYDAYGNETKYDESEATNTSKVTYPNYSEKFTNIRYDYPYNLVPNYDSTDQDFMGFAKEITSTDEKNMKSTSYFDLYGRLRLSIVDSVNTFITTKYNYDDLGRLKNVIHENNDTTMYWYDDWGRIKYKYKTEIGYVSYSYDDMGRLRFTQNSMQSMDHKLNYYQYDDLGRITVQGEASIDIESIDSTIAEPVYLAYDNVVFERLTDNLDPNRLYYQDFGVTDAGILTLNSTLFDGTLSFSPVILDTTTSFYGSNIFDSHSTYPTPYMRHDYTLGTHTPTFADYLDFEDVGLYPEFIRKAVYYDEYPVNEGNIWGELPSKVKVDSIAGNIASNSKGRPTAIAYRDEDGEKLHYSTFGYDARGRITKIIRYNEYLGFDGVFYEYNSANQIIKEVSADPMKQMVTWYSYDQSGRMDSIWVSLDTTGSGFGIETLKMVSQLNKEIDADIAFKYDRNGRTDSIIYNKVDVIQSINYSNRGWVDSLVVNRNSDEILKIAFDRDINGMIDTQRVSYWTKDPLKVKYTYDDYYRLESFESLINGTTNKTESYEYDKMGNRTKKTNSVVTNYSYGSGVNSNKLMSFTEFGSSDVTQYEYNEIGGVDNVKSFNPMTMVTNTKEEFDYLSNGLVKRYVEHVEAATYPPLSPCVTSETYNSGSNTWIYRYNENNQLESKRLFQSDSGDVCSTHSWVYNKIGAYGDVKTVYHGRQYKISSRKVIFYPDKYLSANGLVEIFPDGTKEYNILDNMNSTRMKIKDNDTTLTFADYEPYGENQHHSIDDIPKRGYMGSHKSKENGYMQMGARLYNAETGRFMSVDPLMEIFTGHSPYHYSYNNPVMFRDPSGLAPEGEKNSKVQAPGDDIISSGYTGGFWAEKTISVYLRSFEVGIESAGRTPSASKLPSNTKTIDMYGNETSYVWIESGGGGSAGGSGMTSTESSGGFSGSRNSSRKTYNNTTSKSMRDQNAPQGVAREGMRNTLYANEGGIELLEKYFGVKLIRSPISDHFDLYEISGFTVTDSKFEHFHEELSRMINNGSYPIALSTNQDMNKSDRGENVSTLKSVYGVMTAFIGSTNQEYLGFDNVWYDYGDGQKVAHELFGHIFNYFIELVYQAYGFNSEVNAINSENLYLFLNDSVQRSRFGNKIRFYDKFIIEIK